MATTSFAPAPARTGVQTPWRVGTYLTDGIRLMCVAGARQNKVELEDVYTYRVEQRTIEEVLRMERVEPR